MPDTVQEQRQGVIGHIVYTIGRGVADEDSMRRGSRQVDVVIAGAQPDDTPAAFKVLNHILVEQWSHRLDHHHIADPSRIQS
jgi:hypothetical protein